MFFLFFSHLQLAEEITTQPLYVGGNGPGNYTRIQDALDNVTAGGTVYVFPGTYHETPENHHTGSSHQRDNKNSTIIDGDNQDYVITLEAGNSTLSGFTIIHSENEISVCWHLRRLKS